MAARPPFGEVLFRNEAGAKILLEDLLDAQQAIEPVDQSGGGFASLETVVQHFPDFHGQPGNFTSTSVIHRVQGLGFYSDFNAGREKSPVSQKRERQKDGFLGAVAVINSCNCLRCNMLQILKKMHFSGVILVKLTIPVSEKRDFDEKRDFLEGENGRF
jgi:hypothetical protein